MRSVSSRKAKSVVVQGEAIAALRDSWALSQDDFGSELGRSRSWVQNTERPGHQPIHAATLKLIADQLGLTSAECLTLLQSKKPTFPARSKGKGAFEFLASGKKMPHVFRMTIAASGWEEIPNEGKSVAGSRRDGWIIIRILGDSMEPKYFDGQAVMFRLLDLSEESPMPEQDYLWVRNDGMGTFKRLSRRDDDGYHLRALNTKYLKPLSVSKDELVLVAEARFLVGDIPED